MATLHSAVELPAGRHSFAEFPMTANIQDPTSWDALQHDEGLTRHNSKVTISTIQGNQPISRLPSRPPSRTHNSVRSKLSQAMDHLPQELEAQPLSYFPPRQSSANSPRLDQAGRNHVRETNLDGVHNTQSSDVYTRSTSSASTTGTTSLQDNQGSSVPTSPAAQYEAAGSPSLLSSSQFSHTAKKPAVPTSKYKKKPVSIRSTTRRKSEVEAPIDSPMSGHTQLIQSPTSSHGFPSTPSELPAAVTLLSASLPVPPDAAARAGQAPLQHAKSTASVRKARALHSHPSLPSMKVDASNLPPVPAITPSPSTTQRSRKSVDTIRSRPSMYELQEPSPAPTTPLPELPAGAQPLSRTVSQAITVTPAPPPDVYIRPGTSASTVAATIRRSDAAPHGHAEMASFMTNNSKIIFRRFHDVHVRLLLTLQDEISALELELADIENAESPLQPEQEARRMRILSELRKLMAEYDHLFSNWNLMQASKADAKTQGELEQHLRESDRDSKSMGSPGAAEDLLWLQRHQHDLSCVDLSTQKSSATVTPEEIIPEKKEVDLTPPLNVPRSAPTKSSGGGGGGFASLFSSCTGRRK